MRASVCVCISLSGDLRLYMSPARPLARPLAASTTGFHNGQMKGIVIDAMIAIMMFIGMPTRMKSVNRYPPGP